MRKYIKIITISGLFILVLIQIIWLYSSYQFNKNEIVFKTSNLLENAIDAETFSRLSSLPQGTMVKSRPQSDSGKDIPENECPHVPKLAKFKPPRCPIGVYWNTLCLMRDVWTIKTYMI